MLARLRIVLLEFDLTRDELFILARPIHVSSGLIAELNETIL
jgi:hypothetical protein